VKQVGYRYYSQKERKSVIDDYFASNMKHAKYARTVNVHTRTLYRWLEEDVRSRVKCRLRISNNLIQHYSYEQKIYACKMRDNGATLEKIASIPHYS
jgi:transposase